MATDAASIVDTTRDATSETATPSASTAPTTPPPGEETPASSLDVKYVDSRYKEEDPSGWEYEDTPNPGDVPAELVQPLGIETTDDSWDEYCFVVVRKYPTPEEKANGNRQIVFEIIIKSVYLLKACKDVIGDVRGLSWSSQPVTLDPKLLITFFPKFEEHERTLAAAAEPTEEDTRVLAALRVFLSYIRKNYRQTLARVASLTAHNEITFDLLYAVLIPGSVILRRCPITRETRAMRLITATKGMTQCGPCYSLCLAGLEASAAGDDADDPDAEIGWEDDDARHAAGTRFGYGETYVTLRHFSGVHKIHALSAFPIEYHPDAARVRAMLIARARKWAALSSVHHMQYRGTGIKREWVQGEIKLRRFTVKARVMVDKGNFVKFENDWDAPAPNELLPLKDGKDGVESLTEDDLLLASPILYGFSLSDKLWLEFNVNHVGPIDWNDEAFTGLVLQEERKTLLRSLIEANGKLNESGSAFDDFVRGKGQGLVINLFGPPGVGKTMSAEATSEHLRRPLYIVGSGDLGTCARDLDDALKDAFELAASWNAVLLIDEADVFLEQRSLHDMERNAMVAVFLRHVEYYRGILFLTTNRITTFDEAFLSRIHVALHFTELSRATKAQIWQAFLTKAGLPSAELDDGRIEGLAARDINGRQIKNACRTATSLALSRDEALRYKHLVEALDAMEEFVEEFAALQQSGKNA